MKTIILKKKTFIAGIWREKGEVVIVPDNYKEINNESN